MQNTLTRKSSPSWKLGIKKDNLVKTVIKTWTTFVFEMQLVRLLMILIAWQQATGNILRSPCTQYANFSVTRKNFALHGFTLSEFTNLSVEECENECIYQGQCKSINTKSGTGINCQLVSKSADDAFDNVEATNAAGWTYRTTDYKDKNIGKLCQAKKPCKKEETCIDVCQCPGYRCASVHVGKFTSCMDAYNHGFSKSQIYAFQPHNTPVIVAPCDMTTDGGGWIVFQRRISNSVDFNRGWNDYKHGFGDKNGNFWLGLKTLHKLAGPSKNAILRIELRRKDYPHKRYYAKYATFKIMNEAHGYKLVVNGYSGNAGDSLSPHNGIKFSTKDRDNDLISGHCARYFKGGWWYTSCFNSALNNPYHLTGIDGKHYMSWVGMFEGPNVMYGKVSFSEMKLWYN